MSEDLGSAAVETTDTLATTAPASTPDTSAAPADTSSATGAGDVAPPVDGTPAAPVFAPNFKFKVLDKEHEIPEFLRGAVKDATTEKQLKELHEKAFGLDIVKPKYQETKKQLDQVRGTLEKQSTELSRLGQLLEKNDLDSFFKALKISEEQVLRYALERVQYRELPLEQRLQVDAQMQERQRLGQLEQQTQTYEQQYYAEATRNKALQLDYSLEKPEVKSIADAFDTRLGTPGAFRAEVIKRGQLAFHTTGQDIPVDQAMKEVLALAGGVLPSGGNPAAQTQAPAAAQGSPAPVQPPIIPNVSGRGASPAKRAITSIADLRERARAL